MKQKQYMIHCRIRGHEYPKGDILGTVLMVQSNDEDIHREYRELSEKMENNQPVGIAGGDQVYLESLGKYYESYNDPAIEKSECDQEMDLIKESVNE